jgi:hypothetical protein
LAVSDSSTALQEHTMTTISSTISSILSNYYTSSTDSTESTDSTDSTSETSSLSTEDIVSLTYGLQSKLIDSLSSSSSSEDGLYSALTMQMYQKSITSSLVDYYTELNDGSETDSEETTSDTDSDA